MIPLIYPAIIIVFIFNYSKLSREASNVPDKNHSNKDDSINPSTPALGFSKTSNVTYGVLIRAVNPTLSQMKRYEKWRFDLPCNYDMHLLLSSPYRNSTKLFNSTTIITLREIKQIYPKLNQMGNECRGIRSILWITHTESILMWYKQLKKKYSYIWIIEQDVGVTGNIYSIVSKFENTGYDLITFNLFHTKRWRWQYCATREYLVYRNVSTSYNGTLYTSREYFQRWSPALFNEFDKNLGKGLHAASEGSIPETAVYGKLKVGIIPKMNIGKAFCGKSFTKDEWNNIKSNPSLQNKIFHPLKF